MPEVYKKIEKRIVNLKGKEELWKSRYREIAQQVKELVDINSKQLKEMGNTIKTFEGRVQRMENQTRKTDERSEEIFRLIDKRITELSGLAKGISEKIEENDSQIKKIKADTLSQVNTIITRHEKTFDSILEKINLAAKRIENELQKGEGLYEKMETAKRFMESYTPPDPPKSDPPPKRPNSLHEASESPSLPYQPKSHAVQQKFIPPAPQRFQVSEAPFIYEPGSSIVSPENFVRRSPRKHIDMDDLDNDDMDVDELVSGNMKGFKDSVNSMNMNVAGITEKLASIEDKVAKMQTVKNPGLERLDDKIRMYSDSVTDIHSRMETVEKALRDGMTPMMETMKLLTETVKTLKEDSKPAVRKPTPPREPKKELV